MKQSELDLLIINHANWLSAEKTGSRLYLYKQDISGLTLAGRDLRETSFYDCNMRDVDFSGAILTNCVLQGDLSGANFTDTSLVATNISKSNIEKAKLPYYQIIPEVGQFHAWKKVRGINKNINNTYILELLVSGERTSSLVGRKCRCSKAKVLRAFTSTGEPTKMKKFCSDFNFEFVYEVGKWVSEPNYNGDICVECTSGIHFFISKREAIEYGF
jgi:hypothetical protein